MVLEKVQTLQCTLTALGQTQSQTCLKNSYTCNICTRFMFAMRNLQHYSKTWRIIIDHEQR